MESMPCESCRRPVFLDRHGQYRRHFATDYDGRRALSAATGRMPADFVRLLTVEPTLEERRTHALRLLKR
jgi:hypothetical protein